MNATILPLHPVDSHGTHVATDGHCAPDEDRQNVEATALLMTPEQVAFAMQVSTRTVRRLELQGRIGPVPFGLGRGVRYLREEVLAWIAARCPDRVTWQALRGRGR